MAALINFNLQQTPLVHSIQVADSKAIICGVELQKGEKTSTSLHVGDQTELILLLFFEDV